VAGTWSVISLPDGSARVDVQGDIDLLVESPLVEQVADLLAPNGDSRVLLDLRAVDFIDSSGVRALVRLHQAHGDRVELAAVSHQVRRVLEIVGLAEQLGVEALTDESGSKR
jgi:anti-sigma B factor antagonist